MGEKRITFLFCKAEAVSWSKLFMTVSQQNWEGNILGKRPMWDGRALWQGQLGRLSSGLADKLLQWRKAMCTIQNSGRALPGLGKWDDCVTYWHINIFREADPFCICVLSWALQGLDFLIQSMPWCPRGDAGCFWWPSSVVSHSGETPHPWF